MSRSRWPAVLTTLTVLFAGLSDVHAHAHLCFDGQQAPISLHGHEHGGHEHGGHGQHGCEQVGEHDDVDVDVESQAVLKSLDHDLAALPASPIGWLAPAGRALTAPTVCRGIEARGPPPHALPPPRAPPR